MNERATPDFRGEVLAWLGELYLVGPRWPGLLRQLRAEDTHVYSWLTRHNALEVRFCVPHRCTVTDPIDGDPGHCARAEWEPSELDHADMEEPCRIVTARVLIEPND